MRALLLLLALLLPSVALGASAILTWDAPTTNVDGTPLTDLAGYKVYHGTAPRAYGSPIDAKLVTTYTFIGLGEGTHYFAVTAYDLAGNESPFSNEVSKAIQIPPSAPSLKGSIVIIITP
jgi:hypothetical protein